MKILVTGGLGFIGHRVVAELERLGHSVIITDIRTDYGVIPRDELDQLIRQRQQAIHTDRIYSIDICDTNGVDWLIRKHKPDTIIHLASFPRQKVVNSNPQWGSQVMSQGLLNLLEASVANQVRRFVYVSSSMIYGDFTEPDALGITEEHHANPKGAYGIMKLAGEWLVKDYSRTSDLEHVIVRPSAVYGPMDVEDRVVSKFLMAAMHDQELRVNGAQEQLDFTYVGDAAMGIVGAALSDRSANQTYNITRGQSHSLLEAAKLAVQLAGLGRICINDRDLSFPQRGQLNISRAYRDFGYHPVVNIETGFKLYYDWLQHAVNHI